MAPNTAAETDPLVQALLNETKYGEDEHKRRIKRFDRAYDVYRATGADTSGRNRNFSPWQSRLRVPYAMQVLDTALVNMVTGKPRCLIHPRTPDFAENAKAFQMVMDYYTDQDHLVEKVPMIIQQGLIYGVTVGKTHWLYSEGTKIVNGYDPVTGGPTGPHSATVKTDRPSFEPWDVYDAWWDPNARDVDTCSYVVLRSWATKADLLNHSCTVEHDHERQECNGIYHNVDELLTTGTTRRMESTAQERFLLQQQKNVARKDMFELLEIWRPNQVTVIGNRRVLLRDEPNPHWHGRIPIVIANTRPDVMQLQGIPETELVDHLQQALWTVQNLRMDNLLLTVQRGITYREGGVIDVDALELRPRFKWPVTDHDDVRPFEIEALPPEAYREEEGLLSRMQLITGINPYVSGTESVGADQNTATGVSVLSEVSSRLLRFKASQIQYKCFQRVYEQWGADIQQNMTEPVWVRLTGKNGENEFRQVSPAEVAGEFDFKLEGSDDTLSKQQKINNAMGLLNAVAPLVQLGVFKLDAVARKIAEAFDIDNPDELIAPPQQGAPFSAGGNGQPQLMGQGGPMGPPGQPPMGLPGAGQTGPIQTNMDPRVMAGLQHALGGQ